MQRCTVIDLGDIRCNQVNRARGHSDGGVRQYQGLVVLLAGTIEPGKCQPSRAGQVLIGLHVLAGHRAGARGGKGFTIDASDRQL